MVATLQGGNGARSRGAAFLVLGRASGARSLGFADAMLMGEASNDDVGYSLAQGDSDGDGYGDILVGAVGESSAGSMAGATYLLLGAGL